MINKLHTPTSTEQIYRSNVSNLLNGHLKTDYDCNQLICDYEYILNIEAPKLERGKNRFRTDDFSLFFAALCAVYYQFYISALCNKTNLNEMLNNLKNKIISCLKAISTEYSKLYEDKEINSLFSQYNSCSKKWHMEKRDIMKEFIKSFKCSENEFPFILFIFTTKYFKDANSPIVKNELYIISLYCAYHSNKRFIYKNANNFILNRFFRYKECCERSSKNLILTFFQNYSFTHPKFQSMLAELFVDAFLEYNVQFIIETHSEYLIRKLQTLIAEKKVGNDKVSILYVYDSNPAKRPIYTPQVKSIDILSDGRLSDKFGEGFFDEADRLAMDLLTIKTTSHD